MTLKRERTKNEKIASSSSSSAIDHDEESSLQGIAHIKSAEDRKTAAALSSIDVTSNDDCDGILGNSNSSPDNLDQEAVKKAMERLNKNSSLVGNASGPKEKNVQSSNGILSASKSIKVDPTDVTLLVCYFSFNLYCC